MNSIKRILVVDDEPVTVSSLIFYLTTKGFFLASAFNGREACSLLKEGGEKGYPYDLVITDVMMPEMDGIALMEWIKSTYPATSVILISGQACLSNLQSKMRPTMDDLGSKPFTPQKITELIDRVNHKRSLQSLKRDGPAPHNCNTYFP
jgi:DNA-binding NtrC family response regulator